ncbi:hypothetical protein [Paraburkholderia domus]|uniref:hypothetical protein n=1 Tax=Paraburkholderia domus TaxID=2793075 RepID=UPI001B1EE0D0|nr:hypothetical protein [Paraburkholderia domus]CAE6813813.1 hypothetical protein R75483_05918 [Paraburkholderia domus]
MRLSRSAVAFASSFVALSLSMGVFAQADNSPAGVSGAHSVGVIAPIFSQLVYFHAPANFVSVFENTLGDHYIHEWVLPGESVSNWTQMLTVTGAQDVSAKHPDASPKAFVSGIANGFQRACPSSFAAKGIFDGQLNARDAFIMVVSCGNAAASAGHSETAVIAVIKGEKDFYTLQWSQRGDATSTPMDIDVNMWAGKMKSLMPLKLCSLIPGEQPPYPSCVGH